MPLPIIPVLIVDDDPTVGIVLRGLLRNAAEGFRCEPKWVPSAATALAALEQGNFPLVLLDYQLGDDDGLDVLARIHALPPQKRPAVVMLTGSGNEHVAVESMKRGAMDYLVKAGISLPALRRAISGALERRRLEDELARSTEELRRKNAELEADLAMAREVQQAILPARHPSIPAGQGVLRFSQRWIPSSSVAGDFFSIFPVGDSAAGVLVCDVMGHGVRAALVATLVHGLTRECRTSAADPAQFLGGLNSGLHGMLERADHLVFVTAAYVVLDVACGEIRFANAGHPHPLHLGAAGCSLTPLVVQGGPGTALGMLGDEAYTTGRHPFAPGDGLVVFTDGIAEAANPAGEEFGEDRLRAAFANRSTLPVAERLDGLLADLRAFRGESRSFDDDVCLVGVDWAR